MENLTKEELINIIKKLENELNDIKNKKVKEVSLSLFKKNIVNSHLEYINIEGIEEKLNWIELCNKIEYDIHNIKKIKISSTHYKNIINKFLEININSKNLSICYIKNETHFLYVKKILKKPIIKKTKKENNVIIEENINIMDKKETNIEKNVNIENIMDNEIDEIEIDMRFYELSFEELLTKLNFSYIEVIKNENEDMDIFNKLDKLELTNYQGNKVIVSRLYNLYKYYYPECEEEFKAHKLRFYMTEINNKWIESNLIHEIILYSKLRECDIRYKYIYNP